MFKSLKSILINPGHHVPLENYKSKSFQCKLHHHSIVFPRVCVIIDAFHDKYALVQFLYRPTNFPNDLEKISKFPQEYYLSSLKTKYLMRGIPAPWILVDLPNYPKETSVLIT